MGILGADQNVSELEEELHEYIENEIPEPSTEKSKKVVCTFCQPSKTFAGTNAYRKHLTRAHRKLPAVLNDEEFIDSCLKCKDCSFIAYSKDDMVNHGASKHSIARALDMFICDHAGCPYKCPKNKSFKVFVCSMYSK